MTGSEGLLGVVTEVTVRILQKPETARAVLVGFPTSEDAGQCVADVISAGIIPGGMEMMDRPAIHAAEDFVHAGYPLDVEALLIVELDGPQVEVDHLIERVSEIAQRQQGPDAAHLDLGRRAAAVLGRAQGGLPGRGAHLARLHLHGRHDPAQAPARGAAGHGGALRACTACASPMSSTPATATCTR